ncbi:single-stranded-DNA-specific exonuclease RecJ [Hyphococcus luteus]|uniref:Single-stranded-DNA-specific exonuclease RecJ n=1 Tax=Hyphococcus luteus TaxID=2058213 RepID=A0A2S7K3D9_9PROT|nr:single-stranded-DNA-specific exonuclease RecJ [Marinicaulis flavus]PQA86958.1 single-stranded-DNA-specific exonuclease RecJ [Marinicaulis flavus]
MNADPALSSFDAAMPLIDLPAMGESASGRRWRLREADADAAAAIAGAAGLDPVLARILAARGVDAEETQSYLNPSLRDAMPDPFVLKDMERAAARLARAIRDGETIGVFGDYDVDGTTAAAMLKLYFDAIGVKSLIYLPDRIMEGYGPSAAAFKQLHRDGAHLIVTVDCGAAAHEPVEEAAKDGVDIVVFDHHQMSGPPPEGAAAVVNPNRPDDASGLGGLSAAGVVFMGLVALNRALREDGFFKDRPEPSLLGLLDLAALGLVCDVMPITGLTRVMVAQGLKVLGGEGNQGLKALGARAGMKGAPSAYHLGFLIGPRINAAGRIGHARLAFKLMTTQDPEKRKDLVERLHVLNAERQEIEAEVQAAALRDIESNQRHADDVIVTAGEGWHPGVIGIVAGRLKELYDRPVVVIGVDEGTGKGSGRSITGVDLGAAVSAAREEGVLVAGGGHAMAAGLTIDPARIGDFRRLLNERLARAVVMARANRSLEIDAVVSPSAVTKSFADLVAAAGPYGPGNPEPQFALTDCRAAYLKTVGKGHLSLTLTSQTGEAARAIAFRAEGGPLGEILRSGGRFHVAGKIRADDWRGGDAGQLQITDAAPAL